MVSVLIKIVKSVGEPWVVLAGPPVRLTLQSWMALFSLWSKPRSAVCYQPVFAQDYPSGFALFESIHFLKQRWYPFGSGAGSGLWLSPVHEAWLPVG